MSQSSDPGNLQSTQVNTTSQNQIQLTEQQQKLLDNILTPIYVSSTYADLVSGYESSVNYTNHIYIQGQISEQIKSYFLKEIDKASESKEHSIQRMSVAYQRSAGFPNNNNNYLSSQNAGKRKKKSRKTKKSKKSKKSKKIKKSKKRVHKIRV